MPNSGYVVYPAHQSSRSAATQQHNPANCVALAEQQNRHLLRRHSDIHSTPAALSSQQFPGLTPRSPPGFPSSLHPITQRTTRHSPHVAQVQLFSLKPRTNHCMEAYSPGSVTSFLGSQDFRPQQRTHDPVSYLPTGFHHSLSGRSMIPDAMGFQNLEADSWQLPSQGYEMDFASPTNIGSPPEPDSPFGVGSGSERGSNVDPPYAQLIFRALMSAPGHAMVLKRIYEWFEQNTEKPQRAPEGKSGWKNSIRHNLSMNAAFVKVDPGNMHEEGKKGYIWCLSDEALRSGRVQSTTRFRKNPSGKRRQSGDILHRRQGNMGRVNKRTSNQHEANTSSGSNLQHHPNPLSYSQVGEHPCLTHVSCFGHAQAPMNTIDNDHALVPVAANRSNQRIMSFDGNGYSGSPYELVATPTSSAISTVADSNLADPTSNVAHSPDLKFDTTDIEGVSDSAHQYPLFEELSSHKYEDDELKQVIPDTGLSTSQAMTGLGPISHSIAELSLSVPAHESFGFFGPDGAMYEHNAYWSTG